LADFRRDRLVDRVALTGLDDAAAGLLIESWVGAEATAGLVTAVHDETGGNPFFIEEVLRHLLESGALRRADGRWELARPVRELGVPESVREVIGRRLDRLGDEAVEVLETAAVIGPEFELSVLEHAPARWTATRCSTASSAPPTPT
jgi:predicted ATPase